MSQQAQVVVQAQQKTAERAATKGSLLQHAVVIPAITPVHSRLLQRCSGGVECEECRQKRVGMLQRAAVNAAPLNEHRVPPIVHDTLSSPGQPLDAGTRTFMESRFGHDFSQVRVHTDARAAESARAVNAVAYTVGRDVVFGAGTYGPGTSEGRRLLAHELTHVVQQAQNVGESPRRINSPRDPYEQEADQVVAIVTSGGSEPNVSAARTLSGPTILQRLGANPGCNAAETVIIHQAIFDARGWLNKVIPQLKTSPLSAKVIASLRRNFGPVYGDPADASLIVGRLAVAYHELSTNPFSCAGAADATCAAGPCGYSVAGSHASTICSNVTLVAPATSVYQTGCVLHEALHAAFPRFTVDEYSGWHGASAATATYPGAGTDPLLNADSYTTLVMDLS